MRKSIITSKNVVMRKYENLYCGCVSFPKKQICISCNCSVFFRSMQSNYWIKDVIGITFISNCFRTYKVIYICNPIYIYDKHLLNFHIRRLWIYLIEIYICCHIYRVNTVIALLYGSIRNFSISQKEIYPSFCFLLSSTINNEVW